MLKYDGVTNFGVTWTDSAGPHTFSLDTTVGEIILDTDITPYNTTNTTGCENPVYLPQGLDTVTIRSLLQQTAGFTDAGGNAGFLFKNEVYPDGTSYYYIRNTYLSWTLALNDIINYFGNPANAPFADPPIPSPTVPLIKQADTNTDHGAVYDGAYLYALQVFGAVYGATGDVGTAVQALLYFYGKTYSDITLSQYLVLFPSTVGIVDSTTYEYGAAALELANTFLLPGTLNAPGGKGVLPVIEQVSIYAFSQFLYFYGSVNIGGQSANNTFWELNRLFYGTSFIMVPTRDNPFQILLDPDIQVMENQYGNNGNPEPNPADPYTFPAHGFEYNNLNFIFLAKILQIVIAKAVHTDTNNAYTLQGYTPVSSDWLTNYNYYTTLNDASPGGGDHYTGYPTNDPAYDPVTKITQGPTSVVASMRDNHRRYVALNLLVPATVPIGPAFPAGDPDYTDLLGANSDQSFGYYQYGMDYLVPSCKTGHLLFDASQITLPDMLKISGIFLKDLSIVASNLNFSTTIPTFFFDENLLEAILTGPANPANNVHDFIPNTPANAPSGNLTPAEWNYNNFYPGAYQDYSYFTSVLNPNTTPIIPNYGFISYEYLDYSLNVTYWSTGMFVVQPNNYNGLGNTPQIITMIGQNGQYVRMDLSTQLVTVQFTDTITNVPGIFGNGENNFFGGSNGNNGSLNLVTNVPANYYKELPQLGYVVDISPYPQSMSPLDLSVSFFYYLKNLTAIIFPDYFAYGNALLPNGLNAGGVSNYPDLLRLIADISASKGKYPGSTVAPYFKSNTLSYIAVIEERHIIQTNSAINANLGNPFKLSINLWDMNVLLPEINTLFAGLT